VARRFPVLGCLVVVNSTRDSCRSIAYDLPVSICQLRLEFRYDFQVPRSSNLLETLEAWNVEATSRCWQRVFAIIGCQRLKALMRY
jgi:hypothetical protein